MSPKGNTTKSLQALSYVKYHYPAFFFFVYWFKKKKKQVMKYILAAEGLYLSHICPKTILLLARVIFFLFPFFAAVLLSIVAAASGFPSLSASSV